jgi:hypothetical protein
VPQQPPQTHVCEEYADVLEIRVLGAFMVVLI